VTIWLYYLNIAALVFIFKMYMSEMQEVQRVFFPTFVNVLLFEGIKQKKGLDPSTTQQKMIMCSHTFKIPPRYN
jgi:hypothetical protein